MEENMVKKIENNNMSEALESSLALVDFSATWCGPCKMLAPVLEEISEEFAGKLDFFNADVDANDELALKYGIQNIPALVMFKNGEIADRIVGFQSKEKLKAFIGAHLA
ncbi:thioredoxin [Lachnospiraceae bacterium MD335]|nr:thioredoxin [Lachnospiraceae bacterium MD335]